MEMFKPRRIKIPGFYLDHSRKNRCWKRPGQELTDGSYQADFFLELGRYLSENHGIRLAI